MPPLFSYTLALYVLSGALYCVTLARPERRAQRLARWLLLLGFMAQAIDIGWLCMRGQHPAASSREATFFASFLMVGTYLLFSLRRSISVVAPLVLPVALVLYIVARLSPGEAPRPGAGTLLGSLHIFSATLGIAIFAVAAGSSAIYLLTERQLKRHHLGALSRRGPALETLDTLNRHCILLGFPAFTVALVTGAVWIARMPAGSNGGYLSPQYVLAVLCWLIYAGLLVARAALGLRGRRSAYLTLAGFVTAIAVLLIYLLRGVAAS